jgi:hypothetical protein
MTTKAQVLEGRIRVDDEDDLGYYEIWLGDISVAAWASEAIPWDRNNDRKVKAILMVEDRMCLEAQGQLSASEGEGGYSSWTPGSGPSVYVWDDSKLHDITEKLKANEGYNAALSLEAI